MAEVDDGAALTIGGLSERTGVAPATLRMWEQRHGFPVPRRLVSGHRRYVEADVEAVEEVLRRRARGTRLEAAIEQVVAEEADAAAPGPPSVFAEVRRRHPDLPTHRLHKATLIALSHAIEDEFCAKAERAHLFASFQERRFFVSAQQRWNELARTAAATFVLADFPGGGPAPGESDAAPVEVHLDADAPMRREWAVICDARDLSILLTAFELPGQEGVPDRERLFDTAWSVAPDVVRTGSRICARVAADTGAAGAPEAASVLAADAPRDRTSPAAVTALFNRVVSYVDTPSRSPIPAE